MQLNHFYLSLQEYGLKKAKRPKDWLEAFFLLKQLLNEKDDGSRQVVFIDEMPWLDTPKSGFVTGLESFWNGWGSARKNLLLIVCGSATSWMRDKLINNYGGLYGRVTYEIDLSPFSLIETEDYFKDKGILFSRYDIAQSYMIVGGIPYYLNYFQKDLSLAQNIDFLFFEKHAKLFDEYERLFVSIFSNPAQIMSIVELLGKRRMGYTRNEISEKLAVSNGGNLTANLNALISSDFITKYVPFGFSGKQIYYKLIDPFCLFYLHFIKKPNRPTEGFWEEHVSSHEITTWRGLAFENVCFKHIQQIKEALSITGVISTESAWTQQKEGERDGTQIDMLIDRADNVVNLCEIKYYSDIFSVDKNYYMTMLHRRHVLQEVVPRKKAVRNTLITTYGVKRNEYSDIFSNVITLEELFR